MYSNSIEFPKVKVGVSRRITLSSLTSNIEVLVLIFVLFSYTGLLNDKKLYFIGLLLFCEILNLLFTKKTRSTKWKIASKLMLLVFIVSFVLQMIAGNEINRSIEYIFAFFTAILVSYRISDEKFCIRVIKGIKIMSFVFIIGTLICFVKPEFFGLFFPFLYGSGAEIVNLANKGTYVGFAGEASFNAYAIELFAVLSIVSIIQKGGTKRIFYIVMFIVSLLAIILTTKRSFLLFTPLIVVLLVWYSSGVKKFEKTMKILIALLVLIAFVGAIEPKLFSFMDRMFNSDNSVNLNYRDVIWSIAITQFLAHPLMGIGINRFDVFFNDYYLSHYSYYNYRYFAGAHNSYLQYLSELGIIGFLVVISIMIWVLYLTIKRVKNEFKCQPKSLVNGILLFSLGIQLVTLVYALSGNPMHQYQQMLMYILAVGMSFIDIPTTSKSIT